MDTNQNLLDAVGAALRAAGYTNVAVQNDAGGADITAQKDAGGAYFRVTDNTKTAASPQTTAGGPHPQTAPLEVMMAPGVAELHTHLLANPSLAPAFGFSAEAVQQVK